ncbi:glycine--tRNA ligase [Aeoliella mucimassa]|nr:glycine--tRNA ligase [Aeoliella mucimassa]
MEKIVSLCRRRGFLFQSSEIYGGLNGFWDYGPLGVELKRNVKEAWWRDMVSQHDDMSVIPGAPSTYEMTGLDCTIIMHPQVWKCSGHFDLFCDMMQTCRQCKKLVRADHVQDMLNNADWTNSFAAECFVTRPDGGATFDSGAALRWAKHRKFGRRLSPGLALVRNPEVTMSWLAEDVENGTAGELTLSLVLSYMATEQKNQTGLQMPCPHCGGDLTEPREFNLMFESYAGAIKSEDNRVFLRPETAQGIFVNFKNVVDSTRVRIPFGIAQVGKSFRNEITPRNFTFRSREFEQMEIEFFCHPDTSKEWYQYWRDRRFRWYIEHGLAEGRLQLRDHDPDELSHYSTGTADIEYAFPFLADGEFGELEGIAHRGDFDLRSHMEGKLDPKSCPLEVELGEDGKPKYKGSGRDLTYRDDLTNERFTPHVIEPSAGADRATLAFMCEAYTEDEQPDEKGKMQTRTVMKFHPRLAPVKAAVFPLVKKDGMPEVAKDLYKALKAKFPVFYDEKGAVGRRYRRQDEAGTPYCITVDGDTLTDNTVTLRDRDSLEQIRIKLDDVVDEIESRIG